MSGSSPATFALPASFLGLTAPASDAAWCIGGIPLDVGTTNRSGARDGPAAIRRASRMLVDGAHPVHRIEPALLPVADIGDFSIALGDIQKSLSLIEKQAASVDHLIALGGEHGITLPLLRALARRTGPLALVHFDAHVDTWPDNFGQKYAHGSVFFHAIEERLVDPHKAVQIGIRSPMDNDVQDWTRARGVRILSSEAVHEMGPAAVAEEIRSVVGDATAYLSVDVDVLDPAFAPGTGTPEVGGLASWQLLAILRRLGGIAFAGMDVVEVAPAYDVSEITALAAATVAWEYLALMGKNAAG
ncbi:agmatinase [Rhodoplanes roseus]|uniref:Agmatinase n=1 Tax=Rhodoplanes roseus TaxID=29409 RepID=A0A327KQE0_9BRAD|nr:agmatinase [Rhodoplanes roseus]RAI39555.1 agmatinase [Rhodoplanes roseus]